MQTIEEIRKTAFEFRVAMPETGKQLQNNFEFKLLAWEWDNLCKRYQIVVLNPEKDWDFLKGDNRYQYFPALQFDDIMPLLPETIKGYDKMILHHHIIGYFKINEYRDYEPLFAEDIENHHYAEAAALLYLKTLELKTDDTR